MPVYDDKIKNVLDEMLLKNPLVRPGKMFGFPAYYVGKKLCICLYWRGVGVKLPQESANRVLEQDACAIPFQPYGKSRMREWVQLNLPNAQAYQNYQSLFLEAIQYLTRIQQLPTPAK